MLNEVRDTVVIVVFETRADIQVNANRGGGSAPVLGGDAKSVVESRHFGLGETDLVGLGESDCALETSPEALQEKTQRQSNCKKFSEFFSREFLNTNQFELNYERSFLSLFQ